MARAVYKKADIYLLDDPLSAVDAQVGKQIFEECILGYLSDKIVILATHQLQYMKKVDKILVMDQGQVMGTGDFEQMKQARSNFAKMMEEQLPLASTSQEGDANIQKILNKLSVNSALSMSVIDPEGQQVTK